jgi:uncharacterized membrane protein
MNKARLEAFSDAVFAIAITLLVLEIRVPTLENPTSAALLHALLALWPQYLSYAASFLMIGIYWLNHHAVARQLVNINRAILWRNLVFLMFIAFIPFATAVIGRYGELQSGVLFYGFTLFLTSFYVNTFWWYIVGHGHLDTAQISPAHIRRSTLRYGAGAAVQLVALLVVFFDPKISIALYFFIGVFYLVPGGVERMDL